MNSIHRTESTCIDSIGAARDFVNRGFRPVPIPAKSKAPVLVSWPNFEAELGSLEEHFIPQGNVGLLLGERSNGLIDIDLDCAEAICLAPHWLPQTGWIHGRRGSPDSHWWYRCTDALRPTKYQDVDGTCLLEIRSTGQQTLVPPSTHPSGERLEWKIHENPLEIDMTLERSVGLLAACTLIARHWPSQGSRQEFALTLSGALLRGGLPEDRAERLIRTAAEAANDEEADCRADIVASSMERLKKGRDVRGLPALSEAIGGEVVKKISTWLGLKGDRTEARSTQSSDQRKAAVRLLELMKDLHLFCSDEGKPFATMIVDGHRKNYPINGRAFQRLLQMAHFEEEGTVISANALSEALGVLEAKAQFSNERVPTFIRVGGIEDAIYLDLGTNDWTAVRVDANGWEITNDVPIPFWRSSGLQPLPSPKRHGQLELLREFLNVEDNSDWQLVLAWLVAALRPIGPYPILVLTGQAGTAKSTTAQVLRCLIDPATPVLRSLSRDERDLMIAANSNWILAFDNLSGLSNSTSDILCRLSTGGGYAKRALYTDDEETLFSAQRPIILTSIDDVATREDLLDRSLVISLPPIPDHLRTDERTFWKNFRSAQAHLLGALLDAISAAIKNESKVTLPHPPRLADFARWVTAAEPALGMPNGGLLAALKENRAEAAEAGIDADLVASAVILFMERRQYWTGTASALLNELDQCTPDRMTRQRLWPKTPTDLGNRLRRVSNLLPQKRVTISFRRRGKGGTRMIELENINTGVSAVSRVSPPLNSAKTTG